LHGVFSVGALVYQIHKVVDGFGLGAPEWFLEISLEEAIVKSVDCPLVGDVFRELRSPSKREIYDRRGSLVLRMHNRSSSKDVGVGDIPNRYTSDVVLNQQARVAHRGGMADSLPGGPVAESPWRYRTQ
jgi:hypothetical protein